MYSAFVTDSTDHSFQIPAVVKGVSSGLTWTASDPSVVSLSDGPDGGTLITIRNAGGPVTISAFAGDPAKSGTPCGASTLTLTSATQAQWQAGSNRYNNGNTITIPDGGVGPGDYDASALSVVACTNCHGPTATNLPFKTIAHTPEQAGGFSDSELVDIITKGQIPPNGNFDDSIVPRQAFPYFHTWSASAEELTGLVVYLRSLTPAPQSGSADFGGLGGGGNGGNGGGGSMDSGSSAPPPDAGATPLDASSPEDTGAPDASPG